MDEKQYLEVKVEKRSRWWLLLALVIMSGLGFLYYWFVMREEDVTMCYIPAYPPPPPAVTPQSAKDLILKFSEKGVILPETLNKLRGENR